MPEKTYFASFTDFVDVFFGEKEIVGIGMLHEKMKCVLVLDT
jgi:hypothetical protein